MAEQLLIEEEAAGILGRLMRFVADVGLYIALAIVCTIGLISVLVAAVVWGVAKRIARPHTETD